MDHLFKLKESVMGFLSPAANRRRTIMPSTPSDKSQKPQSTTEPRNPKHKAVIAGRISKKYLSPSDTKRPIRKRRQSVAEYLEDDNVTEVSQSVITPEDSSSQIMSRSREETVSNSPAREHEDSEEDPDLSFEEESELDAEAKVHQFLDRQTELARRQETIDRIREGNWHEDEIHFFQKLSMRGFEPLLPSHWRFDFRTCPATIFSNRPEKTFINTKSGHDFRATVALQSLVTLGGRVRGLMETHKPQEQLIKKELENYIKWSERDGGYTHKRFLPLLFIAAGHPLQEMSAISKAITDQLEFWALRHRQSLALPAPGEVNDLGEVEMFSRAPPILYGVIISHCVAVFVTLDSGKPEAKPKTIAHFDFRDKDMDVWNGFALAILVCTVRNHLMAIRDEMETEDEDEEIDPDM